MRPGRAADHSPPSSAAVMEKQSSLGHTGPVTGSLYLYLYIYIHILVEDIPLCLKYINKIKLN